RHAARSVSGGDRAAADRSRARAAGRARKPRTPRVPRVRLGPAALRRVLPPRDTGGRARAAGDRVAPGAAAERRGLPRLAARDPVGVRVDPEPRPAARVVRLWHGTVVAAAGRAAAAIRGAAVLPHGRGPPGGDA